jgi:hypothetical protein
MIERGASALCLGRLETGLRLVDKIFLQDHALRDRRDCRFFGRDRRLTLCDSRLVIASVN